MLPRLRACLRPRRSSIKVYDATLEIIWVAQLHDFVRLFNWSPGPILTLSGVNLSGRNDRPFRVIWRSSAGNGASGDMTNVVPVGVGSNGAEREA
jgi:hypothetical protein